MSYAIVPVEGGFARVEALPDVRPEIYDPDSHMYADLPDTDVVHTPCITRYGRTREELEDAQCEVIALGADLGQKVA